MKEAGYKETRVFTPETDRFDNEGSGKKGKGREDTSKTRGGVGAVVGFLTGLVTTGQGQVHEGKDGEGSEDDDDVMPTPTQTSAKERLPPLTGSPITRKLTLSSPLRQSFPSSNSQETIRRPVSTIARSPSPTPAPSGYSSAASSRPSSRVGHRTVPAHSNSFHHNHHSHYHPIPKHQFSFSQLSNDVPHHNPVRPQPSLPSHMQTYTQASAARNYLRHMASTPNIPRRKLTPQHSTAAFTHAQRSQRNSDPGFESDAELDGRPPMPPSWLEVVARAILGAPGSHIGGPSGASGGGGGAGLERSRSSVSTKSAPARHGPRGARSLPQSQNVSAAPSRSNTLRGRRTTRAPQDITNSNVDGTASRPGLTTRPSLLMANCVNPMGAKATSSVGMVVKTNVVCRSAPVSREGSRVRVDRDVSARRGLGNETGTVRGKGGGSKGRSLLLGSRKAGGGRKGSRKGKDTLPSLSTRVEDYDFDVWGRPQHPSFDLDDDYSADEESEEGELDLARLLVDPKRQHSIQSLRKHLDRDQRAGATPLTRSTSSLTQSYPHSAASSFRRGRKPRNMDMMGTWLPEDMDDAEEIDGHGEILNGMIIGSGMGGKFRGRGNRSYSRGRGRGDGEDDDMSVRDLTMLAGSSAVLDDAASTKRSRRALPNGWSE